jgi:UDP-3-O-[3-hydroxymyristoyl] glucosamine N-acyltransferase
MPQPRTSAEVAELVGGELWGPGDVAIDGLDTLELAQAGQLTFIGEQAYAGKWAASAAGTALATRGLSIEGHDPAVRAIIWVKDADRAMAVVLAAFAPAVPMPPEGVHPSAIIEPGAQLGAGCRIGANCFVGAGASIGSGAVLHHGAHVAAGARVGDGSVIWQHAVVRERCIVGSRCSVGANAVVGSDGFGFRPDERGSIVRTPHIGIAELADEAEIGAGTCVDRAKFGVTFIGPGTKIDNLCQIGHNCRIGKGCVISGMTGLAGSVVVGDWCQIGAGSGIADHRTIGNRVRLSARSGVMHDIPDGETWGGLPAQPMMDALRQIAAIRTLAPLAGRLKRLVADPPKGG